MTSDTTTTVHPSLIDLRAELATHEERAAQLRQRRAELVDRLAQAQAKAETPSATAAHARAALEAALVDGDPDAIRDAQARAVRAAQEAVHSAPRAMEVQALAGAIAAVDAKLQALGAEQQRISEAEREALLHRLDALAATLPDDLVAAGNALLAVYVRASVMGQIAEAVGGSAGRYGPAQVSPVTIANVGTDRMARPQVSLAPADLFASVRSDIVGVLRGEGFRV